MPLAQLLLQAPFGLALSGSGAMATMFTYPVIGQNPMVKSTDGMGAIGSEHAEDMYG